MFDKGAQVRISLRGQPAVDTGGVRRQFFSTVFEHLGTGGFVDSSSQLFLNIWRVVKDTVFLMVPPINSVQHSECPTCLLG